VTTPRLELRLPTDAELVALGELAVEGVHDPEMMPFSAAWSEQPPDVIRRSMYAWHLQTRAGWTPRSWTLLLVVFEGDEPIGAQDVMGSEFGVRREVGTASWLGRRHHGRGLGTEMRQAVLHLAFDGLGALGASSGAYDDNPASNRVSEKCGYERNGIRVVTRPRGPRAPGGVSASRATELRYRIDREAWLPRRRDDIELHGIDQGLLEMCGVEGAAAAPT